MAWFYLILAGLFEIMWAIGLKYSDGFSKLWPSVGTVLAMALSLWCLGLSLKTVPIGTGYAVWTGIGVTGTAILGMFLFEESSDVQKIVSIAAIVVGIVGLKLSS